MTVPPTPDPPFPPSAERLRERYEPLSVLGRGGMAVVWLARERASGALVAIKLIAPRHGTDEDALRRFAREAGVVARLRHPNLVRTLAVERLDAGGLAIVHAYVHGRTLRAALRAEGAFAPERAARVLRDVAAGLAHAHAARVVHRDVKPENVFLEDVSDRALLADFGIARPLEPDAALTMDGASLGTPQYMAPEQILGSAVDERADGVALGPRADRRVRVAPLGGGQQPRVAVLERDGVRHREPLGLQQGDAGAAGRPARGCVDATRLVAVGLRTRPDRRGHHASTVAQVGVGRRAACPVGGTQPGPRTHGPVAPGACR